MEDRVSFAVCVNVEWPIDLINGGAAKSAMTIARLIWRLPSLWILAARFPQSER